MATSAPTLVITLKDDIWEPGIENGGDAFTALIANIVARSGAETSGWNEHVRRVLRPADIQVSDATHLNPNPNPNPIPNPNPYPNPYPNPNPNPNPKTDQVSDAVAPRDTLTITLPPLPGYAIDAPEVIEV